MRWNIGSTSIAAGRDAAIPAMPSDHPAIPSSSGASSASASSPRPPASCPMHKADSVPQPPPNPTTGTGYGGSGSAGAPAKCPIPRDTASDLNPLNSIPHNLSAVQKQPGQSMDLPIDRTASTIPRPKDAVGQDTGDVWDYPSPQQFYNALARKGWDTPEESIEMMVFIHNFLNEQAWEEVMKWEKRCPGGESAQLSKFQGRPGDLSPKARLHLWAGKLFPSKFNTEPPFDRHDWVVTRPSAGNTAVRYVIDYYSAPDDEEGNPVFSLDVRPALDSLESINQRIKVGFEEWLKGEQAP